MSNQRMSSQELQDLVALKELHKGKGIAATILGIISLLGCLGPIAFICGVIAIFVGANARKKSGKTRGMAGMVMGIIGVVISILSTILIILMMAGIMAPQVASYVDKTAVVEDTKLCDEVRTAITVCMMDPTVMSDEDAVVFVEDLSDGSYYDIYVLYANDNEFTEGFQQTIGIDTYDDFCSRLQSEGADTVEFSIDSDYDVNVRIPGTEIEMN